MTRLGDLILESAAHAHLLAVPPDPGAPPGAGADADPIPVLVADNVAAFFFSGTTQEHFEFARDFPDCVPPVSPVFVELTRPPRIVSGTYGMNNAAHLPVRWGWRFEATSRDRLAAVLRHAEHGPTLESYYRSYSDVLAASGLVDVPRVERALDAPDPLEAARGLGDVNRGYLAAATICRALDRLKAGAGDDNHGLGWLLHGGLVVEYDGLVAGPVATLDLVLNGAGRPAPPPLIDAHGGGLAGADAALLRATILPLTFPAMMALGFMNRDGVTLRNVDPAPEVVRRHAERGLPAPVRYHVMEIGAVAGVDRN